MKFLIGIMVGGLFVVIKIEVRWGENVRGLFCLLEVEVWFGICLSFKFFFNLILFGCYLG